ncbi:TIGR03086 family metal-binding protein [Actinophytocola gossypii]|uniref:TIGR03086 family protein n=1 Tax=Actinophytocola gossypii TaxID=2812003 RepID=A0ABT2J3U1_9PSEU|nr:TIGR03086 family metal-binding protein [Actinophytocola gossypii]MCT2582453.1 TIGR03086 family protein [Actinophytocola gossypii]
MPLVDLLDEAYAWTGKRLAAVPPSALDAPTPCPDWNLRQLLNHLVGALAMQLDAVEGTPAAQGVTFEEVADRAARVWAEPGVLDRTCPMPFGPTPARVVLVLHVTEVVLHGWDVGVATGERATIPGWLAEPLLDAGKPLVTDAHRGPVFGPELPAGDTGESRLLAFYGRTP